MLGLSAGRGKRDAPPPWCRAIAYKNRSSRSLSGGSRTRGCHTGFLPLKGGGEEGVGPASIDSQNLGHRRSQTLIRGTNPAYPRSGADPLLSSPFQSEESCVAASRSTSAGQSSRRPILICDRPAVPGRDGVLHVRTRKTLRFRLARTHGQGSIPPRNGEGGPRSGGRGCRPKSSLRFSETLPVSVICDSGYELR